MKKYKQLTSGQRYQIYGLKQAGLNQTRIAQKMGVDKSTISREFRRNKGQRACFGRQPRLLSLRLNSRHIVPLSTPIFFGNFGLIQTSLFRPVILIS